MLFSASDTHICAACTLQGDWLQEVLQFWLSPLPSMFTAFGAWLCTSSTEIASRCFPLLLRPQLRIQHPLFLSALTTSTGHSYILNHCLEHYFGNVCFSSQRWEQSCFLRCVAERSNIIEEKHISLWWSAWLSYELNPSQCISLTKSVPSFESIICRHDL